MINSMTGYGSTQGQLDGVTYAVEIKTVNSRYLKASIKLPEITAFLERDIEKILRKHLARGTISYVLRLRNVSTNVPFAINESALRVVMEKLGRIASSANINTTVDIGSMVSLPGIIEPALPNKKTAAQIKEKVLSITNVAIEQLKKMRRAEGAAIEADLHGHCKAIKQNLQRIRTRSAAVVQQYHKKLKKRVDELLAEAKLKLDEETVAREVAILAERSDISEELARLDSHLQQFAENSLANANSQAGRRLEFISQEMLREVNTIASKVLDSQAARCAVDIKCRIEQIKEQLQNVQ